MPSHLAYSGQPLYGGRVHVLKRIGEMGSASMALATMTHTPRYLFAVRSLCLTVAIHKGWNSDAVINKAQVPSIVRPNLVNVLLRGSFMVFCCRRLVRGQCAG